MGESWFSRLLSSFIAPWPFIDTPLPFSRSSALTYFVSAALRLRMPHTASNPLHRCPSLVVSRLLLSRLKHIFACRSDGVQPCGTWNYFKVEYQHYHTIYLEFSKSRNSRTRVGVKMRFVTPKKIKKSLSKYLLTNRRHLLMRSGKILYLEIRIVDLLQSDLKKSNLKKSNMMVFLLREKNWIFFLKNLFRNFVRWSYDGYIEILRDDEIKRDKKGPSKFDYLAEKTIRFP